MIPRVHLLVYTVQPLSARRYELGRRFFRSITQSDSCLHDLHPQRRDSEILSRLRRHSVYPIPLTKTIESLTAWCLAALLEVFLHTRQCRPWAFAGFPLEVCGNRFSSQFPPISVTSFPFPSHSHSHLKLKSHSHFPAFATTVSNRD